MTGQQTDLFAFTPDRPLTQHRSIKSWSHSRRTLLEKCPLAYFYQYYAALKRTPGEAEYKVRVRFLKGLSHRYFRAGDLLHRTARGFLRSLQQNDPWELASMQRWALEQYRQDVAYSRSHTPGMAHPSDSSAPVLLMEFYYNDEDAEEQCALVEDRLMEALAHLVEDDAFESFRQGARLTSARIEKPTPTTIGDIRVTVKPDLAFAMLKEGRPCVHVVDWKLGRSRGGEESLQLYAYALGVAECYNVDPSIVEGRLAFLGDGSASTFQVSSSLLNRTRARIIQDVQRMDSVHAYGKQGREEMFTPCAQPRICATCRYREICPAISAA